MGTDHFSIRCAGEEGYAVLVSCAGDYDTGGGLCAWDGAELEVIDRLSSAGMHVAGSRLYRCLRNFAAFDGAEVLTYDSLGARSYFRSEELSDPHFLTWHQDCLVVANTGRNEILWLNAAGEAVRRWRAPGENDSWHINDVLVHDGRLLACAFGRYQCYREYKQRMLAGDGIVFDVETGCDVLAGLRAPHSPRFFDGAWSVCNSQTAEVLQFRPGSAAVQRRLQGNGFTRGFAVTDELLLVGESAARHSAGGETGAMAVIARQDWRLLARVPVPFREISDIVVAPVALLEGSRKGFATNPLRTAEQDQLALFAQAGTPPRRIWPVADALPRNEMLCHISARLPGAMRASDTVVVRCTVRNRGAAFFFSTPPHPIYVSYKWLRPDGSRLPENGEGGRTPLPGALCPGATVACPVDVTAPPAPGRYLLRITMVQEWVAWFDEVDPGNCVSQVVVVE